MKKILSLLLLMLLMFTAGCGTVASAENLVVYFLDVGQADAAILQCGDEVMMIDGGESSDSSLIYSYLTKTLGITHIDYMIATHPHADHIGGLSGALNACSVGVVYSPVTSYDSKQFSSLVKYTQKQGRKDACINANGGVAKEAARLNRELKNSEKERKKLERELQRKEKALAEAAALLVLSKKANAIWGDPEDE